MKKNKLNVCLFPLLSLAGLTLMLQSCNIKKSSEQEHTHEWVEYDTTKLPTCTSVGEIIYKCNGCEETYTEELAIKNHNYVDYVCEDCNFNYFTEGLEFTLLESEDAYSVSASNVMDANVIIPAIYNDKAVIEIGESAFKDNTYLKTIRIPNSVKTIEEFAFANCTSLIEVVIPDSVLSINTGAFINCGSLKNVTLGNGIISIGDGCFGECISLENVTFGNSLEVIGLQAFRFCESLCEIKLPKSIKKIDYSAFWKCSKLKNVEIADVKEFYGSGVFAECDLIEYNEYDGGLYLGNKDNPYLIYVAPTNKELTTYVIHDNTKIISPEAFHSCSLLQNITIPNSVSLIGDNAFTFCSALVNIKIPSNVTYIGSGAFSHCESLENVKLPYGLTMIEGTTFYECSSLTTLEIPETIKYIGNAAIYLTFKLNILYEGSLQQWNEIEKNTVLSYKTITYNHIYITEGLEYKLSIDGKSYTVSGVGTSMDKRIGIPSTYKNKPVTGIENYAFNNCTNIERIAISEGIVSIGHGAFSGCSNLNKVIIPSSVTSIGQYAFNGCYSLTTIKIPDGVKEIEEHTFSACTGLKSVVIGKGVTFIEPSAFLNCLNLETVYYTGTAQQFIDAGLNEYQTFKNCKKVFEYTE